MFNVELVEIFNLISLIIQNKSRDNLLIRN